MEQLILYLVIIVIFSVVGYVRKAARKAAAQQQKPMDTKPSVHFTPVVTPLATNNKGSQGMQDIESLLRSVLGEDTVPYTQQSVSPIIPDEGRINVRVQDEMLVNEGTDAMEKTYGSEFVKRMMSEGVSDLKPASPEIYTEPKTRVHPVLDGFDLRKAVIYAEILKPKFN